MPSRPDAVQARDGAVQARADVEGFVLRGQVNGQAKLNANTGHTDWGTQLNPDAELNASLVPQVGPHEGKKSKLPPGHPSLDLDPVQILGRSLCGSGVNVKLNAKCSARGPGIWPGAQAPLLAWEGGHLAALG